MFSNTDLKQEQGKHYEIDMKNLREQIDDNFRLNLEKISNEPVKGMRNEPSNINPTVLLTKISICLYPLEYIHGHGCFSILLSGESIHPFGVARVATSNCSAHRCLQHLDLAFSVLRMCWGWIGIALPHASPMKLKVLCETLCLKVCKQINIMYTLTATTYYVFIVYYRCRLKIQKSIFDTGAKRNKLSKRWMSSAENLVGPPFNVIPADKDRVGSPTAWQLIIREISKGMCVSFWSNCSLLFPSRKHVCILHLPSLTYF